MARKGECYTNYMKRIRKRFIVSFVVSVVMFGFTAQSIVLTEPPQLVQASGSNEFGIVSAAASLQSDSQKQTAVDMVANAGFGWNRQEFTYNSSIDFTPYDAANSKFKAKGIKMLGLLTYPGTGKSHDDWKNYVQSVVSHFASDVAAWEIMNEADNYLSAADYVVYLKEARDIIKAINPSAIIVLTGITSRPETPNFWSGVAAAGGWDAFDVVGLHVYHSGNPEKVNFGGGDLLAEYDRALASLKKNGGGKKIWITETGYQASTEGNDNQANWLARTMAMTRSVSSIEKIFVYRLYDDGSETYGLTNSSLSQRPAYEVVKNVVSHLGSAGTGTRLYPQSQQVIDAMESTDKWLTKATTNGTLNLSTATGKTGNALKLDYNFTADQAYAVAERSLPISGTPQAIAAWFYGDDTKNVWKYRFKDAQGETFQADLGNLVSGWNYKQFTIGRDTAYVSWDGNGSIDFPIAFNSIVVDRQGGEAAGSGMVDELVAISGGADLRAYQFGSTVAYWTVGDNATVGLCGGDRNFTQTPQYATGVNCADAPKTAAAAVATTASTATAAPKKAASPKPAVTPSPVPEANKEKSTFRVDGANVVADGTTSYRVVILLRTASGEVIKNQRPSLSLATASDAVKLSDPVLVGDEWWSTITATTAGDVTVNIAANGKQIASVTMTFIPTPTPSPSPSPIPSPSPLPTIAKQPIGLTKVLAAVSGGVGIIAGLAALAIWYIKKRRIAS